MRHAVCSFFAATLGIASVASAQKPLEVRIADGRLQGIVVHAGSGGDATGVEAFLGIPYASPPVGRNRWRAPQPPKPWKGLKAAQRFGAACIQAVQPAGRPPWTREYMEQATPSEDCLYLNVWRPAGEAAERLPVLVWLHGGGFVEGSSSVPIYDGAALARNDIIVVSINYRLGALGFLAHPGLTAEAGSSGNYGLLDIASALRWVRINIGAFGGDPSRVTLAGQSAGSIAVHAMMASPAAEGLFVRAIAQSGSGLGQHGSIVPLESLADAEDKGRRFARLARRTSVDGLRGLSTSEILRATAALTTQTLLKFVPVMDGRFLGERAETTPPVNDVPVLTGLNADENSGFVDQGDQTPEQLSRTLERFGPLKHTAQTIYGDSLDAGAANRQLLLDRGVAATALWARAHAAVSSKPVYMYLWRHVEPGPQSAKYGAFHSSEIPYVFGTLAASPDRGFGAGDVQASRLISRYWLNFIKTGDPNGTGLVHWPAFAPSAPRLLELGTDARAAPVLDEPKLDLFGRLADAGGWFGIL